MERFQTYWSRQEDSTSAILEEEVTHRAKSPDATATCQDAVIYWGGKLTVGGDEVDTGGRVVSDLDGEATIVEVFHGFGRIPAIPIPHYSDSRKLEVLETVAEIFESTQESEGEIQGLVSLPTPNKFQGNNNHELLRTAWNEAARPVGQIESIGSAVPETQPAVATAELRWVTVDGKRCCLLIMDGEMVARCINPYLNTGFKPVDPSVEFSSRVLSPKIIPQSLTTSPPRRKREAKWNEVASNAPGRKLEKRNVAANM